MSDKSSATNGKETRKVGKCHPPVEHQFSSTNQPARNGRKKNIETVLKELGREVSPETEAKIYEVLLDAICCKSVKDAQQKLKDAEEQQPEYGLIFQKTIEAIKKDGLDAIMLVLDRVFGKKNHIDLTSGGNAIAPVALVKFLDGKDDTDNKKSQKSDKK